MKDLTHDLLSAIIALLIMVVIIESIRSLYKPDFLGNLNQTESILAGIFIGGFVIITIEIIKGI